MRLFGSVDGRIDRLDRAGWMTPPFDLTVGVEEPPHVPDPHQAEFFRLGPDPFRAPSSRIGPDPFRARSERL